MKILVIVAVATLVAGVAHAQMDGRAPQGKVFKFFDTFIRDNDMKGAYADLFRGSTVEQKKDEVERLHKQTRAALTAYGNPQGYEVFVEEKFGASIVRIIAVMKFEKHPLIWEFYFYKPRAEWLLAHVRFSDHFEMLRNRWFDSDFIRH